MIIKALELQGAAEIVATPFEDDRGWFSRFFCQKEMMALNEGRPIQQINVSSTVNCGTVRGLHYQNPPYAEDKIVRCIQGRVFDVMLDIRKDSATFGQWHSVILNAEEKNMVYIPKGFAHGFQTLEDNCQILYLHTEFHNGPSEGGIAYDSPGLNILWPLEVADLSERDKNLPKFSTAFAGL